jgi:hypothetical protein
MNYHPWLRLNCGRGGCVYQRMASVASDESHPPLEATPDRKLRQWEEPR